MAKISAGPTAEPTINISLTLSEVATIAEALKLVPDNDELESRFADLAIKMSLPDYPEA